MANIIIIIIWSAKSRPVRVCLVARDIRVRIGTNNVRHPLTTPFAPLPTRTLGHLYNIRTTRIWVRAYYNTIRFMGHGAACPGTIHKTPGTGHPCRPRCGGVVSAGVGAASKYSAYIYIYIYRMHIILLLLSSCNGVAPRQPVYSVDHGM